MHPRVFLAEGERTVADDQLARARLASHRDDVSGEGQGLLAAPSGCKVRIAAARELARIVAGWEIVVAQVACTEEDESAAKAGPTRG